MTDYAALRAAAEAAKEAGVDCWVGAQTLLALLAELDAARTADAPVGDLVWCNCGDSIPEPKCMTCQIADVDFGEGADASLRALVAEMRDDSDLGYIYKNVPTGPPEKASRFWADKLEALLAELDAARTEAG